MGIRNEIILRNYSHKLTVALTEVGDFYLEYYGTDEKRMSDVIKDVQLVECSEEFLSFLSKSLIGPEQTGKILPEQIMRASRGLFQSYPIIEFVDGEYVLRGSRSIVAINEAKIDDWEDLIGLISHELFFHAERAREYKIHGDTIIGGTGFYEEIGKISRDDYGRTKIEWTESKNIGIEEALAIYFQCEVVTKAGGENEYRENIKNRVPLLRIMDKWIGIDSDIIKKLQCAYESGNITADLLQIFLELDNLIQLMYERNPNCIDLENKIIDLIKNSRQIR